MNAKHTPGKWEFREIAPYDDGLGYISADGHDIIHAGVSDLSADENRANARLIAAAPKLLFALRYILEQTHIGHIHDTASAAIAKAEEQS